MGSRDPRDRARALLARYLDQLGEQGEREIYLSESSARALRDGLRVANPRATGGGMAAPAAPLRSSGAATARGDGAPSGGRGGVGGEPRPERRTSANGVSADGTTARAADIPEPEVIDVTLAISPAKSAPDMFSEASPIEACATLDEVARIASSCEQCELAGGRTKVVFGVGNPSADLIFVGEAPGRDEDLQGIPFVGRAGQLLDKILAAAEIERDDVYIANIIKCRPPNNRTPLTSEIDACIPYLARQFDFIRPRIVCTLGLPATHTLLGIRGPMGSLRGKIYRYEDLRVIPTYHPAAALRDPKYKRPIWEDFLLVKREYGKT
jgi:uracil-DNA glycosylase family 4